MTLNLSERSWTVKDEAYSEAGCRTRRTLKPFELLLEKSSSGATALRS